ncbi:MAG: hypothetical protein SRB2_04375 [Desulfobacteraceae bacterium Eth-SRB2]|nr:MAG: hypothetical protein SRB2_04375 [Desulfobacteraceae bacterium Eth-SRB2]
MLVGGKNAVETGIIEVVVIEVNSTITIGVLY